MIILPVGILVLAEAAATDAAGEFLIAHFPGGVGPEEIAIFSDLGGGLVDDQGQIGADELGEAGISVVADANVVIAEQVLVGGLGGDRGVGLGQALIERLMDDEAAGAEHLEGRILDAAGDEHRQDVEGQRLEEEFADLGILRIVPQPLVLDLDAEMVAAGGDDEIQRLVAKVSAVEVAQVGLCVEDAIVLGIDVAIAAIEVDAARQDRALDGDLERLASALGDRVGGEGTPDSAQLVMALVDTVARLVGQVQPFSVMVMAGDQRSLLDHSVLHDSQDVGLDALVVGAGVGDLVFEGTQIGDALLLQDVLETRAGDRLAEGAFLFRTDRLRRNRPRPFIYI